MNIENIRKFICDNITTLNDNKNNILYDYIKKNNISHSENKNGLFINLSLCDEKHIHYFYEIINISDISKYNKNKDKDKYKKTNLIDNNLNNKLLEIKKDRVYLEKKIQKDIKLNPFESIILSYSYQ